MSNPLRILWRYTLNNVVFGIALMVLIAAYIAVGSGFASVREYFEMTELEFFDAWPLKLLMLLLCLNLATVTLTRIPLTPPRYGVWCIHSGIITLILGTSLYYHLKVEGKTLIPVSHVVNLYYDSSERALYARVLKGEMYGVHPLRSLPRFGDYDASEVGLGSDPHGASLRVNTWGFGRGDAERLNREDLRGIDRFTPVGLQSDAPGDLASWLGLSKPVTLDVVGFYSYADVVEDVIDDPASKEVGVELAPEGKPRIMLRATDPSASHQFFGPSELEYRQVSGGSLDEIKASVDRLFSLSVKLTGAPGGSGIADDDKVGTAKPPPLPSPGIPGEGEEGGAPETVTAGFGKAVAVAGGAYSVTVDSYNPAFPMFGTHEMVQALTLHVVPKRGKEFWRMILAGRDLQTDFKMDPATTPPMVKGNRQKEPIDKNLVIGFGVSDPAALLPMASDDKHVLLAVADETSDGAGGTPSPALPRNTGRGGKGGDAKLLDIHTSFAGAPTIVDLSMGGVIQLSLDGQVIPTDVRLRTHFRVETRVVPVPTERQNKDQGESGAKQVAVVRVKCGDWWQDVACPCDLYAAPDPMVLEPMIPWSMGVVQIPGASAALQLQLGFTCRPMPVALKLQKFEMVPYAGGLVGGSGMFRDFRSTLEMTDPDGRTQTAVASLNEPIYYDHGAWIFFQAGYDPDGQSSTIGVGNRPGVTVMLLGCVMIVGGLLYAFYVKPVVIRRMKAGALERAKKRGGALVGNGAVG